MLTFSQIPNLDADVLIAGAGPAGSSAATYLSRAGKKTILLDFQQFPRDKVCGDFVGTIALQEIHRLLTWQYFRKEFYSSTIITNAALFLDGRELANHHISRVSALSGFGRVIPRKLLDWWLFESARHSGAQIYQQYRVTDFEVFKTHVLVICKNKNEEKRFKVRALIGADGSSSTIARLLTGNKHSSKNRMLAVRAYYDNLEGPANRADVYYSSKSFPGYYWFFPSGKRTANVGIGMVLETFPENKLHLNDLLLETIENDPALRNRIGKGILNGKIVGWPLSTFDPDMQIVGDRLILTGDAAGLINSLNGEGIQTALSSGRWAAEILIDRLQTNALSRSDLDEYRIKVDREIGSDLMLSQLVIEFIRNRSMSPVWLNLMDIISSRARANPEYAAIAGGVISGIVPCKDILSPLFMAETIMQIGISNGIYNFETFFGGPQVWKSQAQSMSKLGNNIFNHFLNNPSDYLKWIQGLSSNGIELSRRLLIRQFQD